MLFFFLHVTGEPGVGQEGPGALPAEGALCKRCWLSPGCGYFRGFSCTSELFETPLNFFDLFSTNFAEL